MRPARKKRATDLPRGLHQARRTDGSTYYFTRIRGAGDKQDRRIVHDTDDRDRACELHFQLRQQSAPIESATRVRDAWRTWHKADLAVAWKEENAKIVAVRFGAHVDPLLGNRRVCDLTVDDSRLLKGRLQKSGLALQTQAHTLTAWSRFTGWLLEHGYTQKSIIPRRLRPKVPKHPPDPLTEDELQQLEGIGEQYEFPIRLILATGLRWSDLVRLQASNLTRDGWLVIVCSKTGEELRIPIGATDPELAREIRGRVGKLVNWSAKSVGTFNRKVKDLSGLQRFSTYRLKDTFGCEWVTGGNLTDLQRVFGHKDPSTTMRYARPSDERIESEGHRFAQARRARHLAREVRR
jgi:integrase/recombinase XerD